MNAGYTFSFPDRHNIRHIHVVISDPQQLADICYPGFVFFIMLSTRERHKEDCCILKIGDHPSITHDTVAVYEIPPAGFVRLSLLCQWKERGQLIEKEPVSEEVLQRLRKGYAKSNYKKDGVYQFLYRQKVIE